MRHRFVIGRSQNNMNQIKISMHDTHTYTWCTQSVQGVELVQSRV